MLYAICVLDAPDSGNARAAFHDAHLAHFRAHKDRIALAGPLSTDTGTSAGSLVVIEADSEADARTFIQGDPYFAESVWKDITIARFKASIHKPDMLG